MFSSQKKRLLSFFICAALISLGYPVEANARIVCSKEAVNSVMKKDLKKLHEIYKTESDGQKRSIENMLYGSLIDLNTLSYEELTNGYFGLDDTFDQILKRHIGVKENEILDSFGIMTVEELGSYSRKFPKRKSLTDLYITTILLGDTESISFRELDYLNRNLQHPGLKRAAESRVADRPLMVREFVGDYCKIEAEYTQLLNDLITIAAYQYLNSQFSQIASVYSQIGIVPDSQVDIDRQLKQIVSNSFNSQGFKKTLNTIVDKYCKTINELRKKYSEEANIVGYPTMSVALPEIKNLTITNDPKSLAAIPQARRDFIESRQTASTVATVASWFVGKVASTIGKGLFDLYAVGELADSEVEARKKMLESIYKQLNSKVSSYTSNIGSTIGSQIKSNHNSFINYVSSYN